MKLTRASSYALTALAHMAGKKDTVMASHNVAREVGGIPERFLLKVLKPLVSAGILRSVKGPNGGYRLARAAKDVTLLEVIEAVDGPLRGEAPVLEGEKDTTTLNKRLQAACEEAAEAVRGRLQATTLQDLVGKGKAK